MTLDRLKPAMGMELRRVYAESPNEIFNDFFAADPNKFCALLHGCNCFNTMGAGFAKQIKKKFPAVYQADKQTESGNKNKLGNYSSCPVNTNKVIYNCYTQYGYGTDARQFNYEAWYKLLDKFRSLATFDEVYMPPIGSGLAGGEWDVIEAMMRSVWSGFPRPLIVRVYFL